MFKELLKKIARTFNLSKIPYMIIGGQAVLYYGEPRFTRDIDITLGVDLSALKKIVALISRLKLTILVQNFEDFVNKTMVLPAIDEPSGIRVDFIFSSSLYERHAIERARKVKFDSIQIKIASLEDVIIHKIIAGRPRDMEDVKTVLLKNPEYNRKYMVQWLKQFDQALNQNFCRIFEEIVRELG